jgi:hypothetical protein
VGAVVYMGGKKEFLFFFFFFSEKTTLGTPKEQRGSATVHRLWAIKIFDKTSLLMHLSEDDD